MGRKTGPAQLAVLLDEGWCPARRHRADDWRHMAAARHRPLRALPSAMPEPLQIGCPSCSDRGQQCVIAKPLAGLAIDAIGVQGKEPGHQVLGRGSGMVLVTSRQEREITVPANDYSSAPSRLPRPGSHPILVWSPGVAHRKERSVAFD